MHLIGSDIFTSEFVAQPYWWEGTPRLNISSEDLPPKVDVLVIGSGYTGLCASIQTAKGDRSTLVIDAEDIGWGCSSRNGGQVSSSIKPDFSNLSKRYGSDTARQVLKEGYRALDWIGDFIQEEGIRCDFRVTGRFHGAHTPSQYEKLGQRLNSYPDGLEPDAYLVSRSEQSSEICTDFYYGGLVFEKHASLDPAAYHQGILDCALAAGVRVVGRCPALSIESLPKGAGFRVCTGRGTVEARDVVVATSGYTGPLTPWQQRRVIPIGSYIIATEHLGIERASRLILRDRHITDTRRIVVYYRLSPDRCRLLFGGRVSLTETDTRISAPRLHNQMTIIFPQLKDARVSHSWMGFVGWTFAHMPHLGRHNGVWYSLGYCGSGISLASYFGTRLGQQVLGLKEGKTALDDLPFRTRPLYYGKPWFLSSSVWWYRQLDRIGI
jgi:glycine/D-amino acid oxidase-like deaminating enzyme